MQKHSGSGVGLFGVQFPMFYQSTRLAWSPLEALNFTPGLRVTIEDEHENTGKKLKKHAKSWKNGQKR